MIRLIRPDLEFAEVAADIEQILDSGWLTSGPFVKAFEQSIAQYLGVEFATATTSATTALHLAMVARGMGEGDEVLVSDLTFPASGNAIVQTGATPVLVDSLPGRFDLDPVDLERRITERSRAIMVVHPFGQPAEMERIGELARSHHLWVVEDAACALGARRGAVPCGAMGDASCFSFHPRKTLTTGEGGMVCTSDDELAAQIDIFRSHGGVREEGRGLEFVEHGFNYRLSEIQAALGLAQIRRLDEMLAERRRVARLYCAELEGVDELTVPWSASLEECSVQSFVVMLADGVDRDAVITRMAAAGIETAIGTYAMHAQPAFARLGNRPGDLPHSYRAWRQALTLPLYKGMEQPLITRIVSALKSALSR